MDNGSANVFPEIRPYSGMFRRRADPPKSRLDTHPKNLLKWWVLPVAPGSRFGPGAAASPSVGVLGGSGGSSPAQTGVNGLESAFCNPVGINVLDCGFHI